MTLVVLGALAGWQYEGFVGDPDTNLPASTRVVKSGYDSQESTEELSPPPRSDVTRRVAVPDIQLDLNARSASPVVEASVVPLSPPRKWRLADNSGQVWEHADREWLSRWVQARNQTLLAAPTYSAPPVTYPRPPTATASPPPAGVGLTPYSYATPTIPPVYRSANCPNGQCVRTP